ncbi:MAG: hypothetical protein M1404_07200 [Acidobacteria bacterium]|nr:hypothetical protein [Acidobacteriota bacterium]
MSAHTSGEWLLLFCTIAIVIFLAVTFKRRFWDEPLKHGPGFFLGVKVSPGFYEGEGIQWLRRYHTVVLATDSILALAVLAIFASGRWYLFPVWAGGTAVLHTATLQGFTYYTRATLGANPPVHSSVAVPLETRRLSDYISWRVEALIAVITALSWALLLTNGDARIHWNVPVVFTYLILGLLPFKVVVARSSFPLPADRPEEHHRWMKAQRRYWLHVQDSSRWFFIVLLGGYALLHGWHVASANAWPRWLMIGITSAIWLYMAVTIVRGERRLTAMGRDLLPVGSWSTPFRPARLMAPGFAVAFGVWFGGLILLLVFFRH